MPSSSPHPHGYSYSTSAVAAEKCDSSSTSWWRRRRDASGMPCSTYQRKRSPHQYSNHFGPSSGGTKYSISICSNSRVRKMKFPGVISLRNDLPICAIPDGGFLRVVVCTFLKLTKMPCAVSGRRYATEASSSTGPTWVLNIRLKLRASVKVSFEPQLGHAPDSGSWSARNRSLQLRQSTSGSVKVATWPLASHTFGAMRIA